MALHLVPRLKWVWYQHLSGLALGVGVAVAALVAALALDRFYTRPLLADAAAQTHATRKLERETRKLARTPAPTVQPSTVTLAVSTLQVPLLAAPPVEAVMRDAIDLAAKQQVKINRGDYRLSHSVDSALETVELSYPLEASEAQALAWLRDLTLKYPTLQLEQLEMNRASATTSQLKIKAVFRYVRLIAS